MIVVPSESGFEKLRKFIRYPNFDWKISVKTPFVRALNQVATEFEGAYGIKVLSSASKTNGPAYSLELEWSGGERYREPLKISVDLSLAVKIHSRSSTLHPFDVETPAGKVITTLLDSLPYYYAVSAYNHGFPVTQSDLFNTFKASASTGGNRSVEQRHVSLRCSQSCLEQALFLHFGPEGGPTVCLRVLKILRDLLFPNIEVEDFAFFRKQVVTSHWSFLLDFGAAEASDLTVRMWMYQSNLDVGSYIKQYEGSKWISSYALKTLVLLEWEQNPTDEEWASSNLSRRLLNILKRLHHSLTRHELCSFFYRDYKIFPCIEVFLSYEKAIIGRMNILQSLLLSMRDQSKGEYKFEECFENFLKDLKWTCKKVKLYNFLLRDWS